MTFQCEKCGALDGQLEQKPLGGKLGEEVLAKTCSNCWAEWDEMQLKIINEYRLNMAVPQHFDMLTDQMKNFLNLVEGATGETNLTLSEESSETF